jgi:23S rRNA (uracil1939-C5)-methyltransferase
VQALGKDPRIRHRRLQIVLERFEFLREQAAQRAHGVVVATDRSECAAVVKYRQRGRRGAGRQRRTHLPIQREMLAQKALNGLQTRRLFESVSESGSEKVSGGRIGETRTRGDGRRAHGACTQSLQQDGTACVGHIQIEQQQFDLVRLGHAQGLSAVRRRQRCTTHTLDRGLQKPQADGIVVGDQNSRHRCYHSWFAQNSSTISTKRMTSVEVDIEDLSHDGRGVARVEGKAVFVTGALAGERVRMKFSGKHRHYDEAIVEEVLRASPDRVTPKCAHFGVCAGCALQHLAPAAQIAAKQKVLVENLERIGKVQPKALLPALVDSPWGYRRKARMGVKYVDKKGRVLVGFRESNGRYIADIKRCEVLHPAVGTRIESITALVESLEARRTIPQIEVAAGDDLVALIFRHLHPLSPDDAAKLVEFGRAHSLGIYVQPGGVDSVAALWPEDARLVFRVPADAVEIEFQPLDFIQVNGGMNLRMIDQTLRLLDPQPGDRVLDLFCGLGNFTLPIARHVAGIVGVEGETGLVRRAEANASRNNVQNAKFHVADLSVDQRDTPWARADHELLLLDPPRSGAAAVLEYLPRRSTRRIVYVSCHPGSLARDAGILVERHGFRLSSAGVMDMFPHTAHVESIALFER